MIINPGPAIEELIESIADLGSPLVGVRGRSVERMKGFAGEDERFARGCVVGRVA